MSERKESSVLFSLRELRTIEEERIAEEEDEVRRAEEERIRAQMEAERRAHEEQEARRLAQENAERQARDEVERRQREEQLRLEEGERRARVEAQARIEQDRLAREMEIRAIEAQKKRPTWLIAMAGGLVLVVALLGFFAYNKIQENEQQKKAAAAEKAAFEQKVADIQADMQRLVDEKESYYKELLAAKTEEDKLKAQRKLDEADAALAAKKSRLNQLRDDAKRPRRGGGKGGKKPDDNRIEVKCDPSDPLCGI